MQITFPVFTEATEQKSISKFLNYVAGVLSLPHLL